MDNQKARAELQGQSLVEFDFVQLNLGKSENEPEMSFCTHMCDVSLRLPRSAFMLSVCCGYTLTIGANVFSKGLFPRGMLCPVAVVVWRIKVLRGIRRGGAFFALGNERE